MITASKDQINRANEKYKDFDERPFSEYDMMNKDNLKDLEKWIDDSQLVALVDESCGGIIGYINRNHSERIVELLNCSVVELV